ncbi:MAG: GntR family transcriptional regulator [Spirochaetaceae bacterium]|nr:MAG: GntR family transcriptional regulator [Spirochaetaceae bacterium]
MPGRIVGGAMYKVEYDDLSQRVYKVLKQMILDGDLKSGERLAQDELAQRLGVSRTPLLSAFSKLEREMLVQTIPRRGSYVRSFTRSELLDVYDIRLRLEPLGARGAAANGTAEQIERLDALTAEYRQLVADHDSERVKHQDFEFHTLIMQMSGNTFLSSFVASSNIILIANVQGLIKSAEESLAEHLELVDAIRAHDGESAEELMYQHLLSSRTALAQETTSVGSE